MPIKYSPFGLSVNLVCILLKYGVAKKVKIIQPAPPIHKVQTTRLNISGVKPSPAKAAPADCADSCAPILSIGADPITPILIIVRGLPINEIKDTATMIIPIEGPKIGRASCRERAEDVRV